MASTTKIAPRTTVIDFNRPKLFGPSFTRRIVENDGYVKSLTGESFTNTNIQSSESFRYDPPGVGLRSTQQIPLDWSKFENHTFFNSAEANVNVAFDRIINEFPFDGTRKELESYLDGLTGFEKWVLDSFPKNKGYLKFDNTLGGGSYITVKDFAGSDHLTLAKNDSGEKILDPSVKSFTIEMQLLVDPSSNAGQVVCQNIISGSSGEQYGYTIGLNPTVSTTEVDIEMDVSSGSLAVSSSLIIPKGEFVHLAFTMNRTPGVNRVEIFKDGILESTSSKLAELGDFGFVGEPFLIGSGSNHLSLSFSETFNGAIDEFRVFHSTRTENQMKRYAKKNIFPDNDTKLYFKFNEPTGSLGDLSSLVLDSSGNSLHSFITNFDTSLRLTGSSTTNPMTHENLSLNPVLFPAFVDVANLNTELLSSASAYDEKNPNLITRLVPNHYFLEGQSFEGLQNEEGTIGESYGGSGAPGSGELGTAQLLSAFLFVWAKYFDEIKIYLDQLSNVLNVDYEEDGTVADQFLPLVFKHYGFDAPNLFSNATIEQFIEGENIDVDYGTSSNSLQQIQNKIWRRILVNLGDIVRSKGTLHSIKSLIRSIGINPDNTIRIREFGGPTKQALIEAKQTKTEVATLIDFSGSLANVVSSLSAQGIPDSKPFIQSSYLSGSRVEVGFPPIRNGASYVDKSVYPIHGISDSPSDGLFTSGSWTFEGIYKFENLLTGSHDVTQSLVRMATTASFTEQLLWANLIATSGSEEDSKIKLYARPASGTFAEAPIFELSLTGTNIFDGNHWNVSFGRTRNDQSGEPVSSSWFLRAGRQHLGEIVESYATSSYFQEINTAGVANTQENINLLNSSGSFFLIGSQSIATSVSTAHLLNVSSITEPEVRYSNFTGKTGWHRFWSKGLSVAEWESHVLNFKSLGVQDPLTNFNFVKQESGSFERLRVDASSDQPVTKSDSSGDIQIFDFTQNGLHLFGTGFETDTQVIKPETFRFGYISPKFDEASTVNKIRIRGYQSQENVDRFNTSVAPVYQITPSESPTDDTRFTIDFSIVDSLDEDIIKLFSTLDLLDNVLGNPELLHSDDYPGLDKLRTVYFNRLTDKMNLKGFFEFFKWFDGSIGLFIEQLLPRKTNYLGTNFVIESHMLERPKVRYITENQYFEETLRFREITSTLDDSEGSVTG